MHGPRRPWRAVRARSNEIRLRGPVRSGHGDTPVVREPERARVRQITLANSAWKYRSGDGSGKRHGVRSAAVCGRVSGGDARLRVTRRDGGACAGGPNPGGGRTPETTRCAARGCRHSFFIHEATRSCMRRSQGRAVGRLRHPSGTHPAPVRRFRGLSAIRGVSCFFVPAACGFRLARG